MKIGTYIHRWFKEMISLKTLYSILSVFGTLWILVEITDFFFSTTAIPDFIRSIWWLFAISGIGIALYISRPRMLIAYNLNGRDVTIELAIGNVFSFDGALIVGTNTTFDTQISKELISAHSIQGQFTNKYYEGNLQLDNELNNYLKDISGDNLTEQRVGKTVRYPMGSCVRLNPKGRTAYFLAIANLNSHGCASCTFDSLKDCLPKLWLFIGRRGSKEPLVAPVLGTGFGRLPQTREEVIRESSLQLARR